MFIIFDNREHAGRELSVKLRKTIPLEELTKNALILALPRGGLPVGAAIKYTLNIPMDAFLVRKMGAPGYSELAMGAMAMDGTIYFNKDVLKMFNPSEADIEQSIKKAQNELQYQNKIYRKGKPIPNVKGLTVILVDDGLATGSTMRAAINAVKKMSAAKIIVAIPVSAEDTYNEIEQEVDKIVCVQTSSSFSSVGQWYQDFSQVTDEEVDKFLS